MDRLEQELRTALREAFREDPAPDLEERTRGRVRRRAARARTGMAVVGVLILVLTLTGVPRLVALLEPEVQFADPPGQEQSERPTEAGVDWGTGWAQLAEPPLAPRDGAAVTWANGHLFVWGGADGGALLGDGAVYEAASDTWTPLPRAPITPRAGARAVWTGEQVLVWGGYERDPALPEAPANSDANDRRAVADGAAWDLATGAWTPIADAPVPGRGGHGAVWTDRELVVWGGQRLPGAEPLADGAAYDPLSRRWRELPQGPLAPRTNHVMAWADGELLIWGGDTADTMSGGDWRHYEDGAAYDPTADRWRALPGAPIGMRGSAQSAWTGSVLLVVGGASSDGFQLDAAAYDPRIDAWHPIAQPALPGGLAAGVWTGSALLRWVLDPQAGLRGAVWDPAGDRWQALAAPPDGFVTATLPEVAWDGEAALLYGRAGAWRYQPEAAGPAGAGGDRDGAVAARRGALVVLDGQGAERFTLTELAQDTVVEALAVRPGSTTAGATVAVLSRSGDTRAIDVYARAPAGATEHVPHRALSGQPALDISGDGPTLADPVWDPEGGFLAWLEPGPEAQPGLRVIRWTGTDGVLPAWWFPLEPDPSDATLVDLRLCGWRWHGRDGDRGRAGSLLLTGRDGEGRPVDRELSLHERDGEVSLDDGVPWSEHLPSGYGGVVARAWVGPADEYLLTADLSAWPRVTELRLRRIVAGEPRHELVLPADAWSDGLSASPRLRARDGQVLVLDHEGRLLWLTDRGPGSGAITFDGMWSAADVLR